VFISVFYSRPSKLNARKHKLGLYLIAAVKSCFFWLKSLEVMHSLRTLGVIPYLGRCELCDSEYGGQVSLHDPDCISFAGHAAVALLTHTGISFHGVQSHVFHDSCTDTRSPSTV
jgi:hypothetical protein